MCDLYPSKVPGPDFQFAKPIGIILAATKGCAYYTELSQGLENSAIKAGPVVVPGRRIFLKFRRRQHFSCKMNRNKPRPAKYFKLFLYIYIAQTYAYHVQIHIDTFSLYLSLCLYI
jgi:hypothetical protein